MSSLLKASNGKNNWETITDQSYIKTILEALADEHKKRILDSIHEKSKITSEILKECNIPQTSGYRKIESLLKEGLVNQVKQTKDGKIATRYVSKFENLRIIFDKSGVNIKVKRNEKFLKARAI